jgi:tetratricopeptide (TPR) repeat protein
VTSAQHPNLPNNKYSETVTAALKSPLAHRIILVAAILAAYSNSFRCAFQYDDFVSLDLALSEDFSRLAFYLWTPRAIGYASLALDHWLYGDNVVGYHVTNLLIHLGATLLLYALARLAFQTPFVTRSIPVESLGDDWQSVANSVAFFTALLFAVHPVQTQAVTYIVQRHASLASLFYLASIYCYLRARLASISVDSPHFSRRLQVLIFYLLAFLSTLLAMRTKEIAFTLPLAIIIFEFFYFDGRVRMRLGILAPFFLLLALPIIPLAMRVFQLDTASALNALDAATRSATPMSRAHYLFTELRVVVTYLRLLFFPAGQNLDYDYPTYRSLLDPPVLASLLGLLALIGLALMALIRSGHARSLPGRSSRFVALGILWFFLTLSVESSIIPIRDVINEHRLYLPSAGIFLAVCTSVIFAARRFNARRPGVYVTTFAVLSVIAMVFAFLTLRRNEVWATPLSLWTDVTRKSPNRSGAWNNLGTAYLQRQEPLKAIPALIRAYELNPSRFEVPSNIALALKQLGTFEGRYLHIGPEILPKHGRSPPTSLSLWFSIALNNVGLGYEVLGQYSKAIEKFDRVIRMAPGFAPARLNRGLAALAVGDSERARAEQAILEEIAPAPARILRERLEEAVQASRALRDPLPQTQ